MYAVKEKTIIPHYSLEESSEKGNTLFEVREVKGGNGHLKPFLFLPHRKDYYFFFLVSQGRSRHWIDFISFDVHPGSIYFALPHRHI